MAKSKRLLIVMLGIALLILPLVGACEKEPAVTPTPGEPGATEKPKQYTLYIGGTYALTGAFAEDTTCVLTAYQDYAKYVNENHKMAPWSGNTFPENVTLEVMWRDDELNQEKILSIYDELKAKGIMVYRISSSATAMALMERLEEDKIGAVSMASGPYMLTPPRTIFTHFPIYTDACGAIADWFLENWKKSGKTTKPRVAYLTADNAMGKSIVIPEMQVFLEQTGFEFVDTQYVPLVPTSPPTTQLAWLKENKINLTLGVMINPGSQPTIKEAVRLGMGPGRDYDITFGFASPSHLAIMCPAIGETANGTVVAGSYPPLDSVGVPGVDFSNDIQKKYHPDKIITNVAYEIGMIEAMTQVEALRLALAEVSADKLTAADVLERGFYKIKDLDCGEMTATKLTYGPGQVEGCNMVRVDQAQGGKAVLIGNYPVHGIYTK